MTFTHFCATSLRYWRCVWHFTFWIPCVAYPYLHCIVCVTRSCLRCTLLSVLLLASVCFKLYCLPAQFSQCQKYIICKLIVPSVSQALYVITYSLCFQCNILLVYKGNQGLTYLQNISTMLHQLSFKCFENDEIFKCRLHRFNINSAMAWSTFFVNTFNDKYFCSPKIFWDFTIVLPVTMQYWNACF